MVANNDLASIKPSASNVSESFNNFYLFFYSLCKLTSTETNVKQRRFCNLFDEEFSIVNIKPGKTSNKFHNQLMETPTLEIAQALLRTLIIGQLCAKEC